MKICLINTRFPLSLWDFSYCKDIDGSMFPFPPLSLAVLAALTPSGHEVFILDENVRPVDTALDADMVGLTGYDIQKEAVYKLADEFRGRGITVAIGGPLVRKSDLDECSQHADVVFLGEAEHTWPAFIRDFEAGCAQPVYLQNGFVALTDSPTPRFELLALQAYSTAIIETSRGCPHSCEFCEIPVRLGRKSRGKSPEQVMAEIRNLHTLGVDFLTGQTSAWYLSALKPRGSQILQ
ncbi:MAG: cobalamin B12-binding domain-containing protein [Nitrospirae bacterium]|nr:cobalamin B12-binding domain-containing protein [Nitrospirota bacterium]